LIESIEETLKNGDKVTLVGFGTFVTRQRADRKGINPKNWRDDRNSSKICALL